MKQRFQLLVVAFSLVASFSAVGQDVWRTPDGTAIPETSARKAKNGLGVSLVITADTDWQAKWESLSQQMPNFTEATTVSIGSRLTILTFIVNPRPDSLDTFNVVSHIQITRPDGTFSVDAPGLRCVVGKLRGPVTNVRLCEAVIQFSADLGDLEGTWKVKVTVRDENRETEIPVEGSFRLLAH